MRFPVRLLPILLCLTAPVHAALDLRNAIVERLDNGLTVILLVDRNFPVASVQMLYRVGARNEVTGLTGLAHFVEHMAFRSSRNFPDTGLVSEISARGGEWHGYTWTDETTYFATVPNQHLDLLLRIEADRMARLDIEPEAVDAERGVVLAEMHMYENDPSAMLIDALMFASFQVHPYRNNTIGIESDIANISHADVVAFYDAHYHPANAVLSVVGDFDAETAGRRIRTLFGRLPRRQAAALPHTKEPVQPGERRVRITGSADSRQFAMGYRAPSASHPDYPAFLVLQALLGNSSGVSFLQNDWGTAVGEGKRLHAAAAGVTTWFPPSAQDYAFVIAGALAPDLQEADAELAVEAAIASLRDTPVTPAELAGAVAEVREEISRDVETTEDAAHQLAFFEGLGALDVLLTLPSRVAAVTAADVRRVATAWLQPERRTVAWYQKGEPGSAPAPATGRGVAIESPPAAPVDETPLPPPEARPLSNGLPVIVQQSDVSPTIHLQIVAAGSDLAGAGLQADTPIRGYSSLVYTLSSGELEAGMRTAAGDLASLTGRPATIPRPAEDPSARLQQAIDALLSVDREVGPAGAALVVISGDVDVERAFSLAAREFGSAAPARGLVRPAAPLDAGIRRIRLGYRPAQAALGYVVPVPGPGDPASDAYRLLLYVLSHGYEGRFGKEAISRRGLVYYVDSRYETDGINGWITLAIGVDPEKLDALAALLSAEIARLGTEPPDAAEIAEAVQHLSGREQSAAQSNAELATRLAVQWLSHGRLVGRRELAQRLLEISPREIRSAIPALARGQMIIVTE